MDIQSHSYDMHQFALFETGRARENMLRWDGEPVERHNAVVENDHNMISALIYNELGIEVVSVAFPHGKFDVSLNHTLYNLGVRVTFGGISGNYLQRGRARSLLGMGRFKINDSTTVDELLAMVRLP